MIEPGEQSAPTVAAGPAGLVLVKYPRTRHLEGSRLQPGDEDLDGVPFGALWGRYVVVEEKVDGANAGLRFDARGGLHLQSRGHFLRGGPRERHFHLFKQWAHAHTARFWEALGSRYALYGEWLYAKHTVFYDALPHYFLEYDVLDLETGAFLSTERRAAVLCGLPLESVPVLHAGPAPRPRALVSLLGPSRYKTPRWREALAESCDAQGLDPTAVLAETDASDEMEGLYVKVEEDGRVLERFKYVRAGFLTTVLHSGSHWLDRPIVPNRLRPGVDIFA
jgi:hypothetical protein